MLMVNKMANKIKVGKNRNQSYSLILETKLAAVSTPELQENERLEISKELIDAAIILLSNSNASEQVLVNLLNAKNNI